MSNNTNLWWAYDSDSGSFSTLPAGPFLVPALLILVTLNLLRDTFSKKRLVTFEFIAGDIANTDEWKAKKERCYYLARKEAHERDRMTLGESLELNELLAYLINPRGSGK